MDDVGATALAPLLHIGQMSPGNVSSELSGNEIETQFQTCAVGVAGARAWNTGVPRSYETSKLTDLYRIGQVQGSVETCAVGVAGARLPEAGARLARSPLEEARAAVAPGLGFRVWGSGFSVQGSEFGVQGSGCWVEG